jgi:hypothetical protein
MAPVQIVYIPKFLINKVEIHSQSFYFKQRKPLLRFGSGFSQLCYGVADKGDNGAAWSTGVV